MTVECFSLFLLVHLFHTSHIVYCFLVFRCHFFFVIFSFAKLRRFCFHYNETVVAGVFFLFVSFSSVSSAVAVLWKSDNCLNVSHLLRLYKIALQNKFISLDTQQTRMTKSGFFSRCYQFSAQKYNVNGTLPIWWEIECRNPHIKLFAVFFFLTKISTAFHFVWIMSI